MLRSILYPYPQDATVTHNLPSYEGSTSIFITRYDQTIPEEELWSKSSVCWRESSMVGDFGGKSGDANTQFTVGAE